MRWTELCRKRGMASATYYAWKAKYGGLEVSDAKRRRALEEENARLKRLLVDVRVFLLRRSSTARSSNDRVH